jgi:hypothetical protein
MDQAPPEGVVASKLDPLEENGDYQTVFLFQNPPSTLIDEFQARSDVIPKPAALALVGTGVGILALFRRTRVHAQRLFFVLLC